MDMGLRQKTVALAMMFFAVVVVLSSATFFTIYENMRIETTKKAVESLTAQKKEEVESYFDNLESLAYSIGFSSWMQTLFQPKSLDTRTMQEVSENIEYFLGTISGMNEGVRLAAIMDSGERLQGTSPFHLDYSVHLERKSWYPVFLYNGKYIEEGEGKGLYTVVIYLAGLQGVSRQLYEAAEIDGAGAVARFFHITVPMMTPIIFYNFVMAIINSMQIFTQAYIMTDGGPANATFFYSLMVYRTAFKQSRMGYSAAMSWIFFIIIAVLTLIVFKSQKKWVVYENGD